MAEMIERAEYLKGGGRGGEVILETSLGTTSVPSGGIAQVPTEFTQGSRQPDVQRAYSGS